MKNRSEIFSEIERYSVTIGVANENGYFALSTILDGKIKGLEYAKENHSLYFINAEIKRLKDLVEYAIKCEQPNEMLTIKEESNRKIKALEWVLEG